MSNALTLSLPSGNLQVELANTWVKRFFGLMGRRPLAANQALLLEPCTDIHTMWMRFPIDVIFLNRDNKVLRIRNDVRPFRFCMAPKGTYKVLEMTAGNVTPTGISLDDVLNFASITQ